MEMMGEYGQILMSAFERLIAQGVFFTGRDAESISYWLLVVAGYLTLFLIFIPLHSWIKRKRIGLEKQLVSHIDELIFLLAQQQHLQYMDVQALGGSPHLALMKSIFMKGNYDYIQSTKLILDNMHKVEQLLGKQVISQEQERLLLAHKRYYVWTKFFDRFFLVMISIPTFGVYALFRG